MTTIKRLLVTILLIVAACMTTAKAQTASYALIDMQYLSEKIPAYKQATEKITKESERFEKEIEALRKQAKDLYVRYQHDLPKLSAAQRTQREEAIVALEERTIKLQQSYFGPKGELAKKQEQLIKPIQDKIYEAVRLISQRRGYLLVLDRATAIGIVFADPSADISNDVLAVLGISQ